MFVVLGFHCSSRQVQVTCYPGNGSQYVRHMDSSKKKAEKRVVTLIWYCGTKEWDKNKGGQLKIFQRDGKEVGVKPLQDRLVAFQSRLLEHAVLPTYFERYALSCWLCK